MKLSISKRFWSIQAVGFALLTAAFAAPSRGVAQECPFADDDVILYHSPSTIAEVGAIPKVWDCDEGKAVLGKIFRKVEEEAAKKIDAADENERSKRDYLVGKFKEKTGVDATLASLLKAYFERVDASVISFQCPDGDWEDNKRWENAFALTYIVDFDPQEIEFRKLFKEGDEMSVAKDENGLFLAKLTVGGKDVWFGTAKIKDMDRWAAVFAAAQDAVEKKLTRFQNANEFVAKRFGDEKVYAEQIFKTTFFEGLAKIVQARADEGAKGARGVAETLANIQSVREKILAKNDATVFAIELEAADAETAKTLNDLAVGGVAMIGLATKDKELKPEEKLGVNILKSVDFSNKADDVFVRAELKLDFDEMKEIAKTFIWDKILEKVVPVQ